MDYFSFFSNSVHQWPTEPTPTNSGFRVSRLLKSESWKMKLHPSLSTEPGQRRCRTIVLITQSLSMSRQEAGPERYTRHFFLCSLVSQGARRCPWGHSM